LDTGTLGQQFEKLERQYRILRYAVVVLGLALVLPWILGAVKDSRNQTIHGRRFVLSDGKGKLRAFLGADEDEEGRVGLYLYDQLGKRSVALYVKKGHSGLALYGNASKERARLDLGEHDISLVFFDKNGQDAARFSQGQTISQLVLGGGNRGHHPQMPNSSAGEKPNLRLIFDTHQTGAGMITIGSSKSGSHIQLKTDAGGSHLLLRNQQRDMRVEIAPSKDSASIKLNASQTAPSVAIFDHDGNIVSQLP